MGYSEVLASSNYHFIIEKSVLHIFIFFLLLFLWSSFLGGKGKSSSSRTSLFRVLRLLFCFFFFLFKM